MSSCISHTTTALIKVVLVMFDMIDTSSMSNTVNDAVVQYDVGSTV